MKSLLPKKYTKIGTKNINFSFDFDNYKLLYKLIDENDWTLIVRELFKQEIIRQNKILSEKTKLNERYVPFSDLFYNVEPRKHFEDDGKNEEFKLRILKLVQLVHSETNRRPVSMTFVWFNRERVGIKDSDKLMFESCFVFLIEDGHIDVIEYETTRNKIYHKYTPVVAVRKTIFRKSQNPYYKKDIEKIESVKQAKKEGTLFTQKIKKVIDGDDT